MAENRKQIILNPCGNMNLNSLPLREELHYRVEDFRLYCAICGNWIGSLPHNEWDKLARKEAANEAFKRHLSFYPQCKRFKLITQGPTS